MAFRGAVVDLDGTVYLGSEPVPGAADAVVDLRERGLDLAFVTNNPTRSREEYVDHLAGMGIEATPSEVVSAGTTTARFLAERHDGDAVLIIGSDSLRRQLRAAGVELTDDPAAAAVVVTSHDHEFDYDDMTDGLRALDHAEAFYGTDPDLIYPGAGGRPYPGTGAITRAVAGVAEREPDLVLGKPSGPTIETVLETVGHPPEECLVVGDGLDTDIVTGERAGMTTVLVRSGRSSPADVPDAAVEPDFVIDSIADLDDVLDAVRG
jgi:4-nitrophenyl phosphatase